MPLRSRLATAALALAAASVLAACSSGSAATNVELGTEPPQTFTAPEWAYPVAPAGTWLQSGETEDGLRVDVYQLGIAPAIEDSAFEVGNELLFEAGDDVVMLSYIFTNGSEADVSVLVGEPTLVLDYEDNETSTSPDEAGLADMLAPFGLTDSPINYQNLDTVPEGWTALAPGQSVQWGVVTKYVPDAEYVVRAEDPVVVDGEPNYEESAYDFEIPLTLQAP